MNLSKYFSQVVYQSHCHW